MDTQTIAKQAVIAALYAAVCIALAPISYGAVQVRIAEMLVVLPYYNKKHIYGLTIGCLAANMYSLELGAWDLVFGTFATLIVCIIVSKLKTMTLIPVVAAVVNGVIIGAMLYFILDVPMPFLIIAGSVAIGEIIAVSSGVLAMKFIEKNSAIKNFLIY